MSAGESAPEDPRGREEVAEGSSLPVRGRGVADDRIPGGAVPPDGGAEEARYEDERERAQGQHREREQGRGGHEERAEQDDAMLVAVDEGAPEDPADPRGDQQEG